MKGKIYLLAPAYNEEKCIQELMKRTQLLADKHELRIHFVAVNDGSSDNTLQVIQNFSGSYPIKLIDIQPNQGLANAMRTGLQYVWNNITEADVLVTMDGDDSHDPMLIPDMLEYIEQGKDIVIASRFQKGSVVKGLSLFRTLMGRGASILFRLSIGLKDVRDYTCGFRMFSGRIILMAKEKYGDCIIEEEGFSCTAEILLKLSKLGAVTQEVPMTLHYDRKVGASKMKVTKTISQTLALVRKYKKY